jgi:hypothetical protein
VIKIEKPEVWKGTDIAEPVIGDLGIAETPTVNAECA